MSFQTKIKNKLKKIDDSKMYSVEDILASGLILNIKFEPSRHRIYRLIKRKDLPAINMSNEPTQPRWFVSGKDLRKYVENRFISKSE